MSSLTHHLIVHLKKNGASKLQVSECIYASGFTDIVEEDFEKIGHGLDEPNEDHFEQVDGTLGVYSSDFDALHGLRLGLESKFDSDIDIELKSFPTEDWQTGWQKHFDILQTDRFEVLMPWHKSSNKNLHQIRIEPAMAFGTGQHATTLLCLRLAGKIEKTFKNAKVLDVGTGTGILAIAATRMGSDCVIASDYDVNAVHAAIKNTKLNSSSVQVIHGTLPEENRLYNVIFGNILAPVLHELSEGLSRLIASGGCLILSGILDSQSADIVDCYRRLGFKLQEKLSQDEWVALLLKGSNET